VPGWSTGGLWYIDKDLKRMYIHVVPYEIKPYNQILESLPALNIVPGKTYQVQFRIDNHYGNFVPGKTYATIGGKTIPITTTGFFNKMITAVTNGNLQFVVPANTEAILTVDDVSVKDLDSVGGYIDTGAKIMSGNKVSYGGWVKVNGLTGNFQTIMQQSDSNHIGFELYISQDNYIHCWDGKTRTDGFMPELDTWYHAMCVHDGNQFVLYINGERIGYPWPSSENVIATDNFVIGGHKPTNSEWFNGSVDNVVIFNRAVDEAEIVGIPTGNFKEMSYTSYDGVFNVIIPETAFEGHATGTIEKISISNCEDFEDYSFNFSVDDWEPEFSFPNVNLNITYPDFYALLWHSGDISLQEAVTKIAAYYSS
jgi:hypothetical protein